MKKMSALVMFLCLAHQTLRSDNIDQIASAFMVISDGTASSSTIEKPRALEATVLTPEQRQARIIELRKKVKNNLNITPQEAQDVLVEYLLIRFSTIFQEMANKLGDALARISNDVSAGEAIKRLPAAFADGFLLSYQLIKTVATQEYINALKAARIPLKCLFKQLPRTSAECAQYDTPNLALAGVFEHVKKFLLPLAQAMVLGSQFGDRHVQGWVPLGIGVIAPGSKAEEDVKVTAELMNIILNLSDQLKDILPK